MSRGVNVSASHQGRVLVTGSSVDQRFLDQLESGGLTVVNPEASYPPAILTPEELKKALRGCVGYLLGGDEVATEEVLSDLPDLKIISFLGVGYGSFVDVDAAANAGIPVTNTPGVLSNSVAEFTVGLLIEARRKIILYATDEDYPQQKMSDLNGHRIGVLGLGAIGTRICEILTQGFGAKVSYYSRTRKPDEEVRLGISYASLEDLITDVESLIVMVPETAETLGMIDDQLLSRRMSPLTIINTSRPEVNDPGALLAALDSGRIDSVWFDGYYKESTPESELLRRKSNVRITPHIASLTRDARDAMSSMAVDAIFDVLSSGDSPNIVNRRA